MRFAKIDNKLFEAQAGLNALCPGCYAPVIAKCGTHRIHHWAHFKKACDNWSEPETEWHRAWKNNFPAEWQETFLPDVKTGEKHMADVRTSHGLVIEFQHSHIDPKERTTREDFYRNMVWVVDGTRLKRDYPRFLKGKDDFRNTGNKGIYLVSFPDECFASAWLNSSVPVIFDFRGSDSNRAANDPRNSLYCLFPRLKGTESIVVAMTPEFFTNNTVNGEWHNLVNNIIQLDSAWQRQKAIQQRQQENLAIQRLSRAIRFQKRRRF